MIKIAKEGILTKKNIDIEFKQTNKSGIFFSFPDKTILQAVVPSIVSSNRNTVLGNEENNICFVEHLLAAINLLNLDNIEISVNASEIPLMDGSAIYWLNLLKDWKIKQKKEEIELKNPLFVREGWKSIFAYPAEEFSMMYLFKSPINGSQTWIKWSPQDDNCIQKLAQARTFASSKEHELLGVKGQMLSYDENGFDKPLLFEDEPAFHKLLDLFGDLSLIGKNPACIKAHFVSIGGGHSINTQMAKLIYSL